MLSYDMSDPDSVIRFLTSDHPYEEILHLSLSPWDDLEARAIERHLDFVGEIEMSDENYQFDTIRIFVRKADGMILWAHDAGCSCPSPFESTTVMDLRESTLTTFAHTVVQEFGEGLYHVSLAEFRSMVSFILNAAKAKGAR